VTRRKVIAVTGTRAEYGLLRPVLRAIGAEPRLSLEVVCTGTHLLPPALTHTEVEADHPGATRLVMQLPGETTRDSDASALGRGICAFASHFALASPDFVLVLGDRIEAFAAAASAAVAGRRVAHMHGGDRAEGVADESMRHAISKLAHVHLVASVTSVERLLSMGEEPRRTHLVGSPAIDGLDRIAPLDEAAYEALGRPEIILLVHPQGDDPAAEHHRALMLLDLSRGYGRVLALDPNHDPGREGIVTALDHRPDVRRVSHLPRDAFLALLRRVRMLVGNSSAGIIECSALRVRAVDVGSRQSGRERAGNVITCPSWEERSIRRALERAWHEPLLPYRHPWGNGSTGAQVAALLAALDLDAHPVRKQNAF